MNYTEIKFNAPDPLVSQEEKGSTEYGLKYAKYIHSHYLKYGSMHMFYNAKDEYRKLYQYAQGDQSVDQYKKRMNVWDTKDNSWVNIDWTVRNYATKRVNVALGMLCQEKYQVSFDAVDPLALDQKKELMSRARAFLDNKKFIESLGIATEMFIPQELKDKMPQTSDELEVFMNMDYKHRYEMGMEIGVQFCLDVNKYEQIKKELAYDLIVVGIGASRVEIDSNGFPKLTYIQPENLIVPFSKFEDFRDIPWVGNIEEMNVSDVRVLAGSQFTKDEYEDIYIRYNIKRLDQSDQPKNIVMNTGNPQSDKIKVMHFAFLTDIEDVYEKSIDNYGNSKFRKIKDRNRGLGKDFVDKVNDSGVKYRDNGKYQVYRDKYKVVYEGYWIVGSEYIFSYSLKTNMEVSKNDFTSTRLPYHIFAPNMKNGKVVSIMQQMKPKLDDIQHTILRIQHIIASAVPKAVKINYEALLNTSIMLGEKKMDAMDILQLYFQRGIVLYSQTDGSGLPGAAQPIEEMENGMARDFVNYISLLSSDLMALDEIIGTNSITAASTPHPDMLKGVADLSVQATNNAFFFLFHAQRSMYKDTCNSIATLFEDSVKSGSAQIMAQALGQSTIDYIANSDITLHSYAQNIEILPNSQEWNQFYADISGAVDKGVITIADRFLIQRIKNMKEAEQVFIVKQKQREDMMAKQQQQAVIQNAQIQQQSNEQATQNQLLLIQKEGELKMAVLEKEKEKMMLEFQLKSQLLEKELTLNGLMKAQQIHQQGQFGLEQQKMKTEGDIMNTVMDNKTKPQPKEKAPN
jgi:hypothetical protein